MRRHCIVHVHAVDHPAVDLLFENLTRDKDFFDGERIASLTNGPKDAEYEGRLNELGFTVLRFENNAGREMDGFFHMSLPLLCERTQAGLVFFTHSKGTSHGPDSPQFPQIITWNRVMWRHNVSEFDKWIRPNLDRFHCFGTLRKKQEKVASVHPQEYHYSGTFYWLRLEELMRRQWAGRVAWSEAHISKLAPAWQMHYRRYFSEAFPSLCFPLAESFSVVDVEGDTYRPVFWTEFAKANV